MKKLLLVSLISLLSNAVFCQKTNHNINFGVLGDISLFSINYERIIPNNEYFFLVAR